MKAAFLEKPKQVFLADVPVPKCEDDKVLINIKEVGICGSDLHYYNEGRIGDHVVKEPHILGHECSGIVVETGKNVKDFKAGDRVSIEPGVPCLSCELCLEGKYNLCYNVRFIGAPPNHGAFREYIVHDPRFVYKLPENATFTEGALAEPLSVAYNTINRVSVKPGNTVLIIGSGPIGIATLEMAKISGATKIIVTDVLDFRLKVAKKLEADYTVNPLNEDLVERVKEITKGRLCDCVIEASGSNEGSIAALKCVRKGGRVSLVGMGKDTVELPYTDILKKEAVIYGIYRYANNYKPVMNLMESGRINVEAWVTHRHSLDNIKEALELANNPAVEKMKMMIYMD